jgi:hypothetical protein
MWVYEPIDDSDPSALSSLFVHQRTASVATPKQETSLDYLAENIAEDGCR